MTPERLKEIGDLIESKQTSAAADWSLANELLQEVRRLRPVDVGKAANFKNKMLDALSAIREYVGVMPDGCDCPYCKLRRQICEIIR